MDITVIGAGVLGMSAALSLAEEGHQVTVLEQATAGSGASAKAAGIVSTMTWSDEEYRLIAETRAKIGELISMAMIEGDPAARHLWKPYDSITIAKGPQLERMDEVQHLLERNTEEPERMDWRQAESEFPSLRFAPGEEVLVAQEDGVVEAGDLCAVLRGRLDAEDVIIKEAHRVDSVDDVVADHVVVAGGAWTKRLLPELPLQPFRVQVASVTAPEVPIVHDVVQGFYMRPESEGSILAGDGTRFGEFDPDHFDEAGDPEFKTTIAERLIQRVRGAETAKIRNSWAGLVAGTPDQRPLCGAVRDGVSVLSGDNGFGVMRCLALGDRLADAVRGRVDPGLDPLRFGGPIEFQAKEGYGW